MNPRGEYMNRDIESLSISKRLVRSMSQKLKRRNNKNENHEDGESTRVSLSCLTLYNRGGGCKVSADNSEDLVDSKRRLSTSDEGKAFSKVCGNEEDRATIVDCFLREKFWRRSSSRRLLKFKEAEQNSSGLNVRLPDDILEICLLRLPLRSLMNARLVCKKWRNLTTTQRFLQMRRDGSYQNPFLFLFGVVKNGFCSGEIHALDVLLNQWHRIECHALRGRFLFSVASVRDDIYVVGGCSSLTNFGKVDKSSFKTHKGVFVFSPLTKSSRRAPSMNYARSSPVLGVSEVGLEFSVVKNHQNRGFYRSRGVGASDVYEDPHRLSVRRRHQDEHNVVHVKPYEFAKQKNENSYNKDCNRRIVIIAVGGLGSWDEPLDSGEIYDPVSNKWTEIQRLPLDFGVACSGAACHGVFYVYSESDKVIGYDIERGYWIRIQTTLCPPRVHEYYPKLISCKNRVFMLSVSWCDGEGQIGRRNKAVRKLWELDLLCYSWREVCAHPDAPMDWNAAFVGDGELIFGVEMFKIFGQVLDFVTSFDVSNERTRGWSHVSRNRVAQDFDASSCVTKSMAVMRL